MAITFSTFHSTLAQRSVLAPFLFGLSLFWHSAVCGQDYPQNDFTAPLDIELRLSGTFGELRGNHFHSGIDIKTQGRTGLPVKAVAQGYVSRIKVSPYGFGRALYLRHPNGYTSVYAHLQSFDDSIEDYLRREQYRLQRNEVDLFPPAWALSFAQGETVAYSGNSGGSGGPHLHFELRDTRTEKPINPLLFGFAVSDNLAPELYDLQVYEFVDHEMVARNAYRLLSTGPGAYRLSGEGRVLVNGDAAFGLGAIDKLNGAPNRNGVYRLSLFANDELYYRFSAETFAFAETRYLNSHIDYPQRDCCKKMLHRLYREPNNQLSMYQHTEPMKLLTVPQDSAVAIRIVAEDIAGNNSTLEFSVYTSQARAPYHNSETNLPVFAHHKRNRYQNDGLELDLPSGALYRDIIFEHRKLPVCTDCLSEIHEVSSSAIPVHRYYNFSLQLQNIPTGVDPTKLCIVSLREGKIVDYEGGHYRQGKVQARTRQFGQFAVAVDSLSPTIRSSLRGSNPVQRGQVLRFVVHDNLSGIKHYRAYLGAEWVRLYFDAKNKVLLLNTNDLPAVSGRHTLKLEVEDDRQNRNTAYFELILP